MYQTVANYRARLKIMVEGKFSLLVLFILYGLTTNAFGFPSTDADFALLPPYCAAKYNRPGTNPDKWKRLFGRQNWVHIHHYCSGLDNINKAHKLIGNPEKSRHRLRVAIKGIDYMLENATANFVLLPELHLKKGQIYAELKQYSNAFTEYNNAIRLKKDYSAAYANMSDLYVKTGNREEAIKTLEKGLKMKPNSKKLARRLEELKNMRPID